MKSIEIRNKFIKFFTSHPRSHKEIPSAPLVPENDPTVLFITAGMHPLVPYLMGEPHPLGKRLVDVQKSLRTDDIDEVGDTRHFTFFEMLGNWSLGDYFKKEAIEWSFEFLTDKKWLGLDPSKIYVSVFEGDQTAPRDDESIQLWQQQFSKADINAGIGNRIFLYPKAKNWWGPAGTTGPCGPDTEMFYDTGLPLHDENKYGKVCHINCDCGRYLEIWNDVFMQYNKKADGTFEVLSQQNVDTGMGMERIVTLISYLKGEIPVPDPFLTSLFSNCLNRICEFSAKLYEPPYDRSIRIILDHCRAAVFAISDGVEPSNKERGYIVRKLIRRAVRHGEVLGIHRDFLKDLANEVIIGYGESYPELLENRNNIYSLLEKEEVKFRNLLRLGLKEIEKYKKLNGKIAFDLYQSFGFPPELTFEIARETGQTIDKNTYDLEFVKHQNLSRTATRGIFKGGLQDHSEKTTKLHTATHLAQQSLRTVLGPHVTQKGSHITSERLRFDFSHSNNLTKEEILNVEKLVNDKIRENLGVTMEVLDLPEALKRGALTVAGSSYPDKVKVYSIGNNEAVKGKVFSREVCGGPHVDFTGKLGTFKIIKEEAAGTNVRRIYATLS